MMKKYAPYLIVIAIISILTGLYVNTLGHDFVNFDDLDLVVRNNHIRSLGLRNIGDIFTPGVVGAYQPVRTLSYAIDYHFWKLNPTGYHLTNIICHALNTLLVYLIASILTQHVMMASLTSLIFAVHPVHVEAVAWVAGRRDVLSATFALTAFFFFLKAFPLRQFDEQNAQNNQSSDMHGRYTVLWYLLALFLFTSGLLTKTSVVILPLLLIFYELCFLWTGRKSWRRLFSYAPFFIIAIGITQVFLSVARTAGVIKTSSYAGAAYVRGLTMSRVFAEYIFMLFVPGNLSATYGITFVESVWDWSFLLSCTVLVGVLILMIIAWKKSKVVFFGLGWFFISLLPVSNIIPIAITKADRYLYLPSIGFCLVFAWLIVRGWEKLALFKASVSGKAIVKFGYWLMIGLIVLSYGIYTVQRNRVWKDSHTLWAATLETNPDSSIALNNLGLLYAEQSMYEKAIALYQRLLSFHPDQERVERVYANMADAYAGMQRFEEAIDHYRHALDIDPEYIAAYLGLGRTSQARGQYDSAERIYKLALESDPRNESVYNHLGNLYTMQGKYAEAIASFNHVLQQNPFSMNAYNGLGLSHAWKGETDKALKIYDQALKLNPEATIIRNSLGTLYMELGETEKAIVEFTTSLTATPENVEVRNNLGILYLRTEHYKEAAQEFMTCLKYQPNNPKFMSNMGNAYVYLGLYDEAIQMYKWTIEIDPSLFLTYRMLGDVCFGTGQTACAIEAYQEARQLQPQNQEILEKLQMAKEKEAELK